MTLPLLYLRAVRELVATSKQYRIIFRYFLAISKFSIVPVFFTLFYLKVWLRYGINNFVVFLLTQKFLIIYNYKKFLDCPIQKNLRKIISEMGSMHENKKSTTVISNLIWRQVKQNFLQAFRLFWIKIIRLIFYT